MSSTHVRILVLLLAASTLAWTGCSEQSDQLTRFDDVEAIPDVSGTVRDETGMPLENALVTLQPTIEGVASSIVALRDGEIALARAGMLTTSTDDTGHFAFDVVDPGDYLLEARLADHLAASKMLRRAPGDTTFVDVQLTPTGTIQGNVLRENASTHQGSLVYVEGTSYVAVSDPSGDYAITGVPLGEFTVRAEYPHFLEDSTVDSLASAGDLTVAEDLFLRRNSNIAPTVTIVAPADIPIVGQTVQFTAQANDADGTVVLYDWDFENDGVFDASSSTDTITTTFTQTGVYTVKLRVTDDADAIGLDVLTIEVNPDAVFVSPVGSSSGAGTPADPLNSLTSGIDLAQTLGIEQVRVGIGTYVESIALVSGVNVVGGLDPGNDWDPAATGVTRIVASSPGTSTSANGITDPTTVENVVFSAPNNASGNSIALRSANSGVGLEFVGCTFESGNAGNGIDGAPGPNGSLGSSGQNGFPGSCDSSQGNGGSGGPGVCPGGSGGRGGLENGPYNGLPGSNGSCGGGTGGGGGSGGDPGGNGSPGSIGADGTNGGGGLSTSPMGGFDGSTWFPLTSGGGVSGTNGRGGGGGGGGGAQFGTFVNNGGGNGGGGGGGGGERGERGIGGRGGYASIAVLLVSSSPTFVDCTFETGSGGRGGDGGNGGVGGTGGSGGFGAAACSSEIGRGGNGGRGGDGGHGGGGAGGPGGPVFGIYATGTSNPALQAASFQLGSPGTGGAGGNSPGIGGQPGANGTSANVAP